jgi:acyl carrier protein
MNDPDSVLDIVATEIGELLRVPAADITPESRLIDLGAQSFDFVELVVRLEKAFNTSLPRELMIPDVRTVRRYVDLIVASTRPS